MLKKPLFSPAHPWQLLHPPTLSLPRQPLCPGTSLAPSVDLASLKPNVLKQYAWGFCEQIGA